MPTPTTQPTKTLTSIINALIDREGGYTNNPADRGGPTCWGITEQVARAYGYDGDMQLMSRDAAQLIYELRYWFVPEFDRIQHISDAVAIEIFDTGVNMGTSTATKFLQRALNALNRQGKTYPDVATDGNIGPMTVDALRKYLAARGADNGERVLLAALNALQAVRYIEICEGNPTQETFLYGWLANRVVGVQA